MSKVVIFKLSDISTTASGAINVTEAILNQKAVASDLTLQSKSVQSVGAMCTDYSGNIYIADETQHIILKLTEGGQLNVIAGVAGVSGNNSALQNVNGADARFNAPRGIACDKTGNIYVADTGNNQIRIIKGGKVSVYAGNGLTTSGLVDAASNPLQARFNAPRDVAVDNSGNVFVCDTGNNAIRKIWGGQVLTIAGNGSTGDAENVKASKNTAMFDAPLSIAVDAVGNLFVLDTGNTKIKKITPNGWVYLFSGSGTTGTSLGTGATPAYTCTYETLAAVKCDRNGYLYVIDKGNAVTSAEMSRLLKINTFGVPSVVIDFSDTVTAFSGVQGVAVSPAMKVFVSLTTASEKESSSESSIAFSSSSSSSSSGPR